MVDVVSATCTEITSVVMDWASLAAPTERSRNTSYICLLKLTTNKLSLMQSTQSYPLSNSKHT